MSPQPSKMRLATADDLKRIYGSGNLLIGCRLQADEAKYSAATDPEELHGDANVEHWEQTP